MKIAFIYDVIYPYVTGGAEKRNWELAKRLSSRGHEVHILGMKSWEGRDCFISEGVYLHGVCKFRKLYLENGRRDLRQVLLFTMHVIPFLVTLRFDIIDCNAFPYLPFFPVKITSWLRRIPLVVTWQEVWGNYWHDYLGRFRGRCARFIEILVIRLSKNIIAHSFKTKNELINSGTRSENVIIIPHGIDFKLIANTPASHNSSDLIFAGRLIKDKNVDIIIQSVARIKEFLPKVKCFIVGDGPEKGKLFELSSQLNLNDNIIFRDFLPYPELVSLVKSSKIFIFPSSREGFGMVVIEAMACGLPVITAQHPMNAAMEYVKDGENGFICRIDVSIISSVAIALLKDDARRGKFSEYAQDSVSGYSWDVITDKYEEIYYRLVNKNHLQRPDNRTLSATITEILSKK